jgi:hypothetical protein
MSKQKNPIPHLRKRALEIAAAPTKLSTQLDAR